MADDATRIEPGDVLLVTGIDQALLHDVATRFGSTHPGRMLRDRSDLDYERFFIASPALIGRRLSALAIPAALNARILHLRRSDADLPLTSERILEAGDRIGVPAPRASYSATRCAAPATSAIQESAAA